MPGESYVHFVYLVSSMHNIILIAVLVNNIYTLDDFVRHSRFVDSEIHKKEQANRRKLPDSTVAAS